MSFQPGFNVSRRGFLGGAAAFASLAGLSACSGMAADPSGTNGTAGATGAAGTPSESSSPAPATTGTRAEMAARAVVPVMCYHQVREWTGDDTEYTRNALVIPPAQLRGQLTAARDAGYTAISADQYYNHITTGAELPAKPFMITFDDGKDNQRTAAAEIVNELQMPATLFIMTVVIGNEGWVTKEQIREIDQLGVSIGSHTWDHHRVDEYTGTDKELQEQLVGPKKTLEDIVGKPVVDFAYPYGAWDPQGAAMVAKAGYRTGYQLQDKPLSTENPLYTIRRQLMGATYTPETFVKALDDFKNAGEDSTYTG